MALSAQQFSGEGNFSRITALSYESERCKTDKRMILGKKCMEFTGRVFYFQAQMGPATNYLLLFSLVVKISQRFCL